AANASELGFLHVWSYNTDKAVRVVDRVLKRVEDVMPAAECRLLLAKVGAIATGGDLDAALAALAQAQELLRSLDDPHLECLAARMEAVVRFDALQFARALDASRDAMRRYRLLDDAWGEVSISWVEPFVARNSGRPADAMRLVEERQPLAERLGHPVLMLFKQEPVFDAMYRGDLEAAEAAAYEGLAFEGGRGVRGFVSTVRLLLGMVHMLQGRCVG